MDLRENYLNSVLSEFKRYKNLGDKTFSQLGESDIHWIHSEHDNSTAVIVKHMTGNMRSRWTNFLTEDGEKEWRHRDTEFEDTFKSKEEMITAWENGWDCLFEGLTTITAENFNSSIKIRNEELNIIEAFNRQLAHKAYHTGQIVLLGKMIKGKEWVSLSIPKGGSEVFNRKKFGQ